MERPAEHDLAEATAARALGTQTAPGGERPRLRVTPAAVGVIDGCEHAAISLLDGRGRVSTVAATDGVPLRVDALQYELRQGPCLDAIAHRRVFVVDDLATQDRWPVFGPRTVAETGVHSMASFGLVAGGAVLGSLNLYSRATAAFDERARTAGIVLAVYAALALAAAQETDQTGQPEETVRRTRRIRAAIDIITAVQQLTDAQARAWLTIAHRP